MEQERQEGEGHLTSESDVTGNVTGRGVRKHRSFPLVLKKEFWAPLLALPPEGKRRFLDALFPKTPPTEPGPASEPDLPADSPTPGV